MALASVNVKRKKVNNLRAERFATAQVEGIETTKVVNAIPSISNDGYGPYSDGEVQSKIEYDGNSIGLGRIQFYVKESVSEIIALDDA